MVIISQNITHSIDTLTTTNLKPLKDCIQKTITSGQVFSFSSLVASPLLVPQRVRVSWLVCSSLDQAVQVRALESPSQGLSVVFLGKAVYCDSAMD